MSRMHQVTAAAAIAILLTGCASRTPVPVATRVVTVQVPCPTAAPEKRPPFPPARLANLDPAQPGTIAKAYALSLTEHSARADELEKLLDACR